MLGCPSSKHIPLHSEVCENPRTDDNDQDEHFYCTSKAFACRTINWIWMMRRNRISHYLHPSHHTSAWHSPAIAASSPLSKTRREMHFLKFGGWYLLGARDDSQSIPSCRNALKRPYHKGSCLKNDRFVHFSFYARCGCIRGCYT